MVGAPMVEQARTLIALRDSSRDYRLIAASLGPASRAPLTRDEEERLLSFGGVYAEKTITGTCGPTTTLPGPFGQYGPFARCAETTTFTIRLSR